LVGANAQPAAAGVESLASRTNYYAGNDPANWRAGIPHYASVQYAAVYPDVDLVYHGRRGELEYEFRVAKGATPDAIRLRFGAKPSLDQSGDLLLHTAGGTLRHRRPVAYQLIAGRRREISAAFRIEGSVVGFRLGPYDARHTLIIDPVVSLSTYLGGTQWDAGYGVAADAAGDAYVTGETASTSFPGRTSPGAGNRDVFVTRIGHDSSVLYTTILSSAGNNAGQSIAVDATGNAYVAGIAGGSGFPVTGNAFQRVFGGTEDAFVAKLDSAGHLVYCTYLGGGGADGAFGIAVSAAGNAYVTGYTESVSFPTTLGAPQRSFAGGFHDAFLAQLSRDGDTLVYSTLLGGSGNDIGWAVAVDTAGNAVLAGSTDSLNLPVQNAWQPGYGGGGDAIVASLNAVGSAWNFVAYAGGSGVDQASGVAVDSARNIFVTGYTASANFPVTAGAYQGGARGGYDAFVMKMGPSGTLLYSTVFGGSGADAATALAVGSDGEVWVGGYTTSNNLPLVDPLQNSNHGGFDGFVSEIAPDGASLRFSTYLGGAGDDRIWGLARDATSGVLLTGYTSSTDFPTTAGALQTVAPAGYNAFLTRIQPAPQAPVAVSVTPASGSGSRQTFAFHVSDPAGYGNLGTMLVLFNTGVSGFNACYLWYDVGSSTVALASDAGAWSSPVSLGSSAVLQNSQCSLGTATSFRTAAGNNLVLNLDLYFKPAFAGTNSTFVYIDNRMGLTPGWQQLGAWTAP